MGEKVVEIIVSDIGDVRVVIRPGLDFEAEGYRIFNGSLEIFGDGRKVSFSIPEDSRSEVLNSEQLILSEFDYGGMVPRREMDLLLC